MIWFSIFFFRSSDERASPGQGRLATQATIATQGCNGRTISVLKWIKAKHCWTSTNKLMKSKVKSVLQVFWKNQMKKWSPSFSYYCQLPVNSAAKQQISWVVSLWRSPLTFVWPGIPKQCATIAPSSGLERHLTIFCIDEIVSGYVVYLVNQRKPHDRKTIAYE